MADVFLSYAREDLARIEPLVAAIEASGRTVWYDQSLRAGADFGAETAAALESAKAVVVVWSPHSVGSKWVRDEAGVGRDASILIPISLDGATPPLGFRQIQTIDFGDWPGDPSAPKVKTLLAALDGVATATSAIAPAPSARARILSRKHWLAIGVITFVALAAAGSVYLTRPNAGPAAAASATIADTAPDGAPVLNKPIDVKEKSVAVLPFLALSSGADDGYFADGLTEEIINALATLPDLLVTARTSAFHFKGKDTPIPEIAATLGVAHVVEGSVRRAGDKVRITAQLIRASDGFHLWSETYDRPLNDVFAAQTDIAENVARTLGVLLDERKRTLMADVGVRDVEAFLAYQRGRSLWALAHSDAPMIPTLKKANVQFEAAIARKPDFAAAYFLHTDLYGHILMDEAPGAGRTFVSAAGVTAEEAARRLAADLDAAYRFEMDPGQRLAIQALRTTISPDWRGLNQQIARAYAAAKNCRPSLWLAQPASVFGYADTVHQRALQVTRCDPLAGHWLDAAETAVYAGRPDEALKFADQAEASNGESRSLAFTRILAYLALGRFEEADAQFVAGNFNASGIAEGISIVGIMVPAAAGRAIEWESLRPALEHNPDRLLVAAAVFGDRAAANAAAAEIDRLPLGGMILVRATNRCYCGALFDLEATPNFAQRLDEGSLPWPPPSPIDWPLKDW